MAEYRNFTELVRAHVAERPEREALVLLTGADNGLAAERVTYARIDAEARRLAGWLQERGAAGHPVIVVQSTGRLFATSFLACLYAGAMAVPAPPPGGVKHHTERLIGIVKDTAAHSVLTDTDGAPGVSLLLAQAGYGRVPCLATDALSQDTESTWQAPDLDPSDIAFLQYTSGSTSDPKGVMVSHGNLIANQKVIASALGSDGETVMGSWLPFHHDMGLIGHLLHPLSIGGTGVLMPPALFVRHPVRWLQAITEYGITSGGGPNFAYDLCVRRITEEQMEGLDLSRWENACNGAEPVRAETLRSFAARFAPVGLTPGALWPCYGLAEATLLVTGSTPGVAPRVLTVDAQALENHRVTEADSAASAVPAATAAATAGPERGEYRELVSSGRVHGDFDLRIVNPDNGRQLAEGRVGEIWLRGDSVARGYWNRPLDSCETFASVTSDGESGFLRTGDLGTVVDGELYVTGRLKDIMIVAGRNLYPQDIERVAQQVSPLFGFCTAFSVGEDKEQAVLIQEIRTSGAYDLDLAALAARVYETVAKEFEISVAGVLLVRPGTVRRTTSGKVQRSAMRKLFLRGAIEPLHALVAPDMRRLVEAGSSGRRGRGGAQDRSDSGEQQ
ncbi:fatty acyl-AMP ligase [Wenjunlia tyrosinilytica]|uniref:Polyketide synthase n=1 Tax=Wenjunlia tyrosinilytica TaxID=1544741 RepID=A0A918DXS1_9ACTN|nr:fatty acyl-AMP ligase [Wenjunlia tyrosinilytica]GGO89047.1 polyketide synthase [Wenjunlia tyrosinilytica]